MHQYDLLRRTFGDVLPAEHPLSSPLPPNRSERAHEVSTMIILLSFLLLFLVATTTASRNGQGVDRTRSQFKSWFPQYGFIFANITNEACLPAYQTYLYGQKPNSSIDWYDGGDTHTEFIEPLINCILNNTSPYIQYQLQTAQIILGLTPTVLAVLGASTDETALLTVIGKRPLLAFLLAASSPSVYSSRAFEYRDMREILRDREGRYSVVTRKRRRLFIVVVEYVFVLAALTNAAALSWELGTKTVSSIATEVDFLPATWAVLGIVVHGLGVILFRLRAMRCDNPEDHLVLHPSVHEWAKRFRSEFSKFWRNEIGWDRREGLQPIYVRWFRETRTYIVGSWIHSTGTVVHIIFGTLVFSGMNFVGPRDATQILGRYMASIVGCRVVLMYELAIVRERYNVGLREAIEDGKCSECQHLEECLRCGGKKSKGNVKVANGVNGCGVDYNTEGVPTLSIRAVSPLSFVGYPAYSGSEEDTKKVEIQESCGPC